MGLKKSTRNLLPLSQVCGVWKIKQDLDVCRGRREKVFASIRNVAIEGLYQIYKLGYSLECMAEFIGFSATSILKWFQCRGYKLRPPLWWHENAVSNRVYVLLNERFFRAVDSSLVAYWLGFLWADGYLIKGVDGYQGVRIEVHESDKEILEMFKSDIGWGGLVKIVPPKLGSKHCRVDVYSKVLAEDLRSLGLIPRRSENNLPLPEIPLKFRRDFIRGLVDGDGGISRDKRVKFPLSGWSLSLSGSIRVVEYYRKFLSEISPSISGSNGRNGKNEKNRVCYVSGVKFFKVISVLYAPGDRCLESHRKVMACLIDTWGAWIGFGLSSEYQCGLRFVGANLISEEMRNDFLNQIIQLEARATKFWGFRRQMALKKRRC